MDATNVRDDKLFQLICNLPFKGKEKKKNNVKNKGRAVFTLRLAQIKSASFCLCNKVWSLPNFHNYLQPFSVPNAKAIFTSNHACFCFQSGEDFVSQDIVSLILCEVLSLFLSLCKGFFGSGKKLCCYSEYTGPLLFFLLIPEEMSLLLIQLTNRSRYCPVFWFGPFLSSSIFSALGNFLLPSLTA